MDKKSKTIIIGVATITALLLVAGLGYQKFIKLSKVNEFNVYLNECSDNLSQCDLGNEETDYKDLIAKSKQAVNDKNIDKIGELEAKLKESQQRIVNRNKDYANNKLGEIKNINISILNQDRKAEINDKTIEIERLIENMKFKTADGKIEELEKKEKELILDQKLDNVDNLIQDNKRSEARNLIKTIGNETLNGEQKNKLSTYNDKAAITPEEACIISITKVFGEYKYVTPVKIESNKYTANIGGHVSTWSGGVARLDETENPKSFLFSTKPFDKYEVADAEKIFDSEHSSWMVVYPTKEKDGSYKISGRFYNVTITPANGGDIIYDGSQGFHNGYIRIFANEDIYVDGKVNKVL